LEKIEAISFPNLGQYWKNAAKPTPPAIDFSDVRQKRISMQEVERANQVRFYENYIQGLNPVDPSIPLFSRREETREDRIDSVLDELQDAVNPNMPWRTVQERVTSISRWANVPPEQIMLRIFFSGLETLRKARLKNRNGNYYTEAAQLRAFSPNPEPPAAEPEPEVLVRLYDFED
jgi:hypothetical protein